MPARPRDRDPRGEVGVAPAADRDEDPADARESALHHRDVTGRCSEDLLDRRAEEVPTRTAVGEDEQIGPGLRQRLRDRRPTLTADDDVGSRGHTGRRELRERAAERTRLGLRRRERLSLGDLDRRYEQQVVARGEPGCELHERTLALDVRDDHGDLHGLFSTMTGKTRSRRTRGQACARARRRMPMTAVRIACSTASAMTSPFASGGT